MNPNPDPLAEADPIDRSPTRPSAAVAVAAAVASVGILAAFSEPAGLVAVPGVPLVAFGLYRRERRWVGYGAVALVVGVALTGAVGAGPRVTVPAALCALLAWDAGGYAITLGEQLGRAADTARAELVHAGLTVAVGAAGVLLATGPYLAARGERPALAVVLLFAGALALLAAVGRRRGGGSAGE